MFCICLGMQLLASKSFEEKPTKGLGIISNKVKKFSLKETKNKIRTLDLISFLIKGINYLKVCNQELIFILFIPTECCPKICLKISQKQIMVLNFYHLL